MVLNPPLDKGPTPLQPPPLQALAPLPSLQVHLEVRRQGGDLGLNREEGEAEGEAVEAAQQREMKLSTGAIQSFKMMRGQNNLGLNSNDLKAHSWTSTQDNMGRVRAKAKVVIELLLSVAGVARPSQVYFGGDVKGESAIKTEEEIGSLIDYEFKIINLGKPLKSFGTASLNIQWPKENVDGKWLLYLVKISTTGLEEIPCSPETEINSLKHIQESSTSRKKREVGGKKSGGKITLLDQKKHKILMCGNGYDARCVVIKCPLQGLDSSAVIALRCRLWNATFLENYASLNYLDIIVKASISLDAPAKNMVLRNAETQVRVTVFPEKAVTQYGGVPWWIILVAVLAGILMLALLVFLLWKCGFFKRAPQDQYDAAYHKAQIHVQASDKEKLTTEA